MNKILNPANRDVAFPNLKTLSKFPWAYNAVGREAIAGLRFLASLPRAGARREKTQPFNWIDSRLFTVHRCAPSLPHRLRDLRLRRGIHVQRTPGGQNWFAKSDQVVLMWKNNLRGRSRKSRGVRACVSARHAAFPQGRKEGGQQVPWVHACTLRLMVCTHQGPVT